MKIVVTCYDLLSDIEQNYLCDASVFENGHIVYEYDGICYNIMMRDDAVLLSVKYGDSFTRLYAKNGKGKAVVSNEFGKMELDLMIIDHRFSDNCVSIEYKLLLDDSVTSHFRYVWKGSV